MSPATAPGAAADQLESGATAFEPWASARATAKPRTRRPLGERLTDLYIHFFSLAVIAAITASLLQHSSTPTAAGTSWVHQALIPGGTGLPVLVVLVLGVFALGALGVWVLLASGPVAAGRAELVWGFQLPVDRRPFLHRALTGVLVRGAVTGAVVCAVMAVAVVLSTGPTWALLPLVLTVTAVGAGVSGAAVIFQSRSAPREGGSPLTGVLPWVVAACLVTGAGGGLLTDRATDNAAAVDGGVLGWMLDPAPALGAAAVALVLLGITVVRARRAVYGLGWEQLEAGNGHATVVRAAAATFDLQDLYRALTPLPRSTRRNLVLVPHRPTRPWVALWRAETVGWLRLPGSFPLWTAAAGAMLMIAATPGWGTPAVVVPALVITALVAADLAAAATRITALTPEVETILPISATAARLARVLTPCLAMAAWAALVLGVLGVLTGTTSLVALGALTGIGLGATAVVGARRPPLDWSGAVIMTDAGVVPIGVISQLTTAHTLGLLVLVPAVLALIMGTVTWPLLGTQALFSAGAIYVAMRHPSTP
ncbi:DUF6297 family protein [Kocuria rosea]|uniref:DUF6297 family protein n=1 Tax=Kocuria rosea TaxID=1275 RepID=UPI003D330A47